MDLFTDGAFVRLRNRARRGKYVHANEDGIGVSLRPLSAVPSLNAVWKVQLWAIPQGNLLLLQGAAYGRYIAVAHEEEFVPPGHRGVRAVQRDYNLLYVDPPFMWRADRVEAGRNYVRLRNYQRCLRANGRHRRWINAVTVDTRNGNQTKMMQWMVEAIPSTPVPLPLAPPPQPPPIHVRHGLFRRRTGHDMQQGRRIRHRRTDDDGNYVHEDWPQFVFNGNSVINLRTQVARLEDDENITLCVKAGWNGRPIPLVSNLASNRDLMYILAMPTGSPAAARLRYPQFDQPQA